MVVILQVDKKRYVFIGAGGFGSECYQWFIDSSINKHNDVYDQSNSPNVIFIDEQIQNCPCPTIKKLINGSVENLNVSSNDRFLITVAYFCHSFELQQHARFEFR